MDADAAGRRCPLGRVQEALTVADFGNDAPGGGTTIWESRPEGDAGFIFSGVLVLYGSARGDRGRKRVLSQDSPGVPGTGDPDAFGAALAGADYGNQVCGTGSADLAIGSPVECLDKRSTVACTFVAPAATRLRCSIAVRSSRPLTRNSGIGGQLGATGP